MCAHRNRRSCAYAPLGSVACATRGCVALAALNVLTGSRIGELAAVFRRKYAHYNRIRRAKNGWKNGAGFVRYVYCLTTGAGQVRSLTSIMCRMGKISALSFFSNVDLTVKFSSIYARITFR